MSGEELDFVYPNLDVNKLTLSDFIDYTYHKFVPETKALPTSKKGFKCLAPCAPVGAKIYHLQEDKLITDEKSAFCPVPRYFDNDTQTYKITDTCPASRGMLQAITENEIIDLPMYGKGTCSELVNLNPNLKKWSDMVLFVKSLNMNKIKSKRLLNCYTKVFPKAPDVNDFVVDRIDTFYSLAKSKWVYAYIKAFKKHPKLRLLKNENRIKLLKSYISKMTIKTILEEIIPARGIDWITVIDESYSIKSRLRNIILKRLNKDLKNNEKTDQIENNNKFKHKSKFIKEHKHKNDYKPKDKIKKSLIESIDDLPAIDFIKEGKKKGIDTQDLIQSDDDDKEDELPDELNESSSSSSSSEYFKGKKIFDSESEDDEESSKSSESEKSKEISESPQSSDSEIDTLEDDSD